MKVKVNNRNHRCCFYLSNKKVFISPQLFLTSCGLNVTQKRFNPCSSESQTCGLYMYSDHLNVVQSAHSLSVILHKAMQNSSKSLSASRSTSETGHFRPKGLILQESSPLKENHVHTFEVRPIKILFVVWCELSALNQGLHRLSWAGVEVCVWEGCVCRGGGQREMLHLCSITWGVETEAEQRRRRSMVGHFHIWQKLLQAEHQTWGEKILKKQHVFNDDPTNEIYSTRLKLFQSTILVGF